MTKVLDRLRERVFAWEAALVTLAVAIVFVSIPLALGEIGLSWDALNHHIYLGWTAEHPRFDRDYMAASYQAYQFPYLYWPVYRLAMAGLDGATAGALLALPPVTAVPAVWIMARVCIGGTDWYALTMRFIAVALAFASGVVLSMLDTTANDLLSAIPLVWAIALALRPLAPDTPRAHGVLRPVWLSGVLAGMAVACKFSNGPLAITLPVLWMLAPGSRRERIGRAFAGGVVALLACAVTYGWWGWQLWQQFGNPMYPLYDNVFEGLRAWSGWRR